MIQLFCGYDQLNYCLLAEFRSLSRRLFLIKNALKHPW